MRKHELVHLHALARTVADDLVATGDLDPAVLAGYETLGVTPMSLQAARGDHERALLVLTAAVADALAEPDRQSPRGDTDRGDTDRDTDRADGRVADPADGPTR
ncbi:UPF0058 family protein [Halobaculum lipolyticum]|uniref:UPF0058 family protein n=1 Tax=Halobaculum lipolyticum TaxID=3032001 RepID=A0ABD5W6H9_9EURY|nr:UPF0058 family protein [Halobaculum sp. DT31]